MIRVLFVAANLSYGGAQKMLTFVANNINRNDFCVSILNECAEIPPYRPLMDDILLINQKQYKKRGIRRIQETISLIKIIRKNRIDIVVSFLDMPNFISSVAGLVCNIPVIISERGDPGRKMSISDRIIRKFETVCAGAVFQTEGAMAYYPEKLIKKSILIPNPVVPVAQLNPYKYAEKITNIAFVGRFENIQKRQDLMVDAFKIVSEKNDTVLLHFYGTGPDEEKIKKQVIELNLSGKVFFHGKVANPINELMNMDMYVISSDYEGIPNSLIEAMSIGMPCVATDCSPGGASLLINDGENGLIVSPGNKDLLADAMTKYIRDPSFAKMCGENAKQICKRFSSEKIVDMWCDYIKTVFLRSK